jgi:hypothetical protein
MKSFLKVAPLFPPPPYTWLMTTSAVTTGAVMTKAIVAVADRAWASVTVTASVFAPGTSLAVAR